MINGLLASTILFGDDFITLQVPAISSFVFQGSPLFGDGSIDINFEATHVVPLPAGAWLFLTAIGGLFGMRKLKAS